MAVHSSPTIRALWEETIPAADLEVYASAGFGTSVQFGQQPCLVVIDVVESFLGPRPGEPAQSSDFMSCAPYGWERMPAIIELIDTARSAAVPIVFVKGNREAKRFCGGSVKASAAPSTSVLLHSRGLPSEIQPRDDEYVMEKPRPSVFFGTPLLTYLHRRRIDTLLIAGCTTSGCIRASVIDSAAYGYSTFVVEDAVFDRSMFSHAVNTFEIHQKYADVIDLQQTRHLLANRPS